MPEWRVWKIWSESTQVTRGGKIHQDRCEMDPMYNLLLFPQHNGAMDHVVDAVILYLRNRYSIRADDPAHASINERFRLLATRATESKSLGGDYDVKLFFVLCFLYKERELSDACAKVYSKTNPDDQKALFPKGKGVQRYNRFIHILDGIINGCIRTPYNKQNITKIIRATLAHCTQQYLYGRMGIDNNKKR